MYSLPRERRRETPKHPRVGLVQVGTECRHCPVVLKLYWKAVER